MHTVIFSREYRHRIDELREARYPPNVEIEVSNEVAEAARKAGALKEEENGVGPTEGNRTGGNDQPEKRRAPARNRPKSEH